MNAFRYIENDKILNQAVYDNIIAACILHDGLKGGKGVSDYKTYEDHPILVEQHYKECFSNEKIEPWQQEIFNLIVYHMGFWTPQSVRKPMCDYLTSELIVYLSDFFASRKELVTKVDTFGMELEYEN